VVENRKIFIPHLHLAPPQEATLSEFRETDYHENRMIGLSCGKETVA